LKSWFLKKAQPGIKFSGTSLFLHFLFIRWIWQSFVYFESQVRRKILRQNSVAENPCLPGQVQTKKPVATCD
jgi:hypothetical protein